MGSAHPLSILVVDDDPRIRALLRRTLQLEGYRVLEAADGKEALKMLDREEPDLVILDVLMPGPDGFAVCERIREREDVPILMLTARDEVGDRVRGLRAGADDYLVKPFAMEELLARIHSLLRRAGRLEDRPLRFASLFLDPRTREVRREERLIPLTPKEFDLLKIFLQNPRRILDRDTLVSRAWGYDYEAESNTLEVHISSLRQKLGEPRLIHTVRGAGYILREPDQDREPEEER